MRLFLTIVFTIGFAGCTASFNRPDNIPLDSDSDWLRQQVMQDMAGLHFTPQGTCPFTPQEAEAYDSAKEQALANLLVMSHARGMDLDQLQAIFDTAAQIAVRFDQGAILIDERNGFVLVNLYRAFCPQSSHHRNLPMLYVFDRTGNYWPIEYGIAYNMQWVEDRWVGFLDASGDSGRPSYTLTHIAPSGGQWRAVHFSGHSHGPALIWGPGAYIGPPAIVYQDGYRELYIPESSARYLIPGTTPPCDFADTLHSLPQAELCPECGIRFYAILYQGNLTLEWRDGQYSLTDESSSQVIVVLSDYTKLSSQPPSAVELVTNPDLRPGSWRDYCQSLSPNKTPPPPTATYESQRVEAIYQPFERGFMVRRADQHCVFSFSQRIVLGPDNSYHYCVEYSALPDSSYADTPPQGLTVPVGPFGKVWNYYATVRDQLGYATCPEQSYFGEIQPPGPVLGGGPFEVPMVPLPDGRVLYCGMRAATAGSCSVR